MSADVMLVKSIGRKRPWYGVVIATTESTAKVLLIEPIHVEEGPLIIYKKQPAVKLPSGTAYMRAAHADNIKDFNKLLTMARQKGLM